MYPIPSGFPQWASRFVDTAPAFTLGYAYWFHNSINLSNELEGLVTVLKFWTDSIPVAAWISIFLVMIIVVSMTVIHIFGEIEVVMSSIKFMWIFVVILTCVVISAGGAPNHQRTGFQFWNADPFPHGFKGFLTVLPTCVFAMGGTEITGLVAAEARNPRHAIPRAVTSNWVRFVLFYVLGSLMVTITVSPTDKNLFGASGVNASPFVISFRNAGIDGLAHATNAIIFISVLSSGNAQPFLGSRTLFGMAQLRMAPKIFAKSDSKGRPWAGIVVTLLLGGGLGYLNVNESGMFKASSSQSLTDLPSYRCEGVQLVLQSCFFMYAFYMGNDFPMPHSIPLRLGGAGTERSRLTVENLDLARWCILRTHLVHFTVYCRVLPFCLARKGTTKCQSLLCKLRIRRWNPGSVYCGKILFPRAILDKVNGY